MTVEKQEKQKSFYKLVDVSGDEQTVFYEPKKTRFFPDEKKGKKKSNDEYYTPSAVYRVVVDYVNEKVPLNGKKIIRPFFPGGDYESIDYPENIVVIDNPPFSFLSQICRFFIEKKIKFFLFSPHLTVFSADMDCTYIVTNAKITYENGITIKTSFVSNMFGDTRIFGDAYLCEKLKTFEKQKEKTKKLPKYRYPKNIITPTKIAYCVDRGVSIKVDKKDVIHCPQLDCQKKHKKTLFGGGFIASDYVADEIAVAQEKAREKDNFFIWELSDREREIINRLNTERKNNETKI